MKRVKIAVLILVLSVVLSICSLIFITEACENIIEKLDKTIVHVINNDIVSAKHELDSIIKMYEKSKPFFNIIIGQAETIEIRSDLNKSIFFVNLSDTDSAILHLQECKTDLNRIIVSNIPSVSTIL